MFVIGDVKWQGFRESLKGVSTEKKLDLLEAWLKRHKDTVGDSYEGGSMAQTQVDNYINALKRGGQLDRNGNVVR